MDIRIDIIEAVKDALQDRVDDQTLAIVQDTLVILLLPSGLKGLLPKHLRGMRMRMRNSSGFWGSRWMRSRRMTCGFICRTGGSREI